MTGPVVLLAGMRGGYDALMLLVSGVHSGIGRRIRAFGLACLLASVLPAVARADEPTIPDHDARLDGYPTGTSIVMDAGGTSTTYILLFLVGGLGLGVVFIKSKRTHLD